MSKSKQYDARERVLKDMIDELDEKKRLRSNTSKLWRLRGYMHTVEYWFIAYSFYLAIAIWFLTGDFWKAIAWYATAQLYTLSANFRGLSLHVENGIEWLIKKTI